MKNIIILIIIAFNSILLGQEVLDKIVAVVGDEIILKSELDFQADIFAAQRHLNPDNPKLRKTILNKMIEDKLLYSEAVLDSIEVSDEEVKAQINNLINYYTQQYGSQDKLEKAYGMSVERIKREMRDNTRKNLMSEKLKAKKFGKIDISRREVVKFYEENKDSLGQIPEKFKIAHIFINPKSSARLKEKAKKFAESLLDSLKKGADFAELAKKFSDDPGSAKDGGDLGFVKRGVFYPEFEAAAFALKKGEISGVIESPVGFHIIQLLERRGESIHTRHILIKPKNDSQSELKAIELLSDIRDSIVQKKNTLAYYAEKYSDDKQTASKGGVLGTFEASQLEKSMLDQIYKLKVGEISFPKRLNLGADEYGFHIIKLLAHIPAHKPNIVTDYDEIKKLAEFKKRETMFNEWITELKKKIYWKIRT